MTTPPPVTLTAATAERLLEVMDWTEEFLRTASPQVHTELRRYLDDHHHPTDVSWLVDMLGFQTMHLRRLLQPPAPQQPTQQPTQEAAQEPAHAEPREGRR